jgi:hypothetical protein
VKEKMKILQKTMRFMGMLYVCFLISFGHAWGNREEVLKEFNEISNEYCDKADFLEELKFKFNNLNESIGNDFFAIKKDLREFYLDLADRILFFAEEKKELYGKMRCLEEKLYHPES